MFAGLVESDGALVVCGITALELCYSARNRADYEAMHADLSSLHWLDTHEVDMVRAWEVQRALAGRGQHRLSIPDLIIAAVAERTGAIVLHYDRDYELISAITGQPVRWIVRAGTV